MAWAFDVTANIPRITQSGTDTGLAGIATAITALGTVARSTAYTTAQMVKPPAGNGMWYRCSTAGTTSATAPTYNPVLGSTTTDGTAVFTAFQEPLVRTLGTTNNYYMPDVRFAINGTLTVANPQQENFVCSDVIGYGCNWTSGQWASDGVTPRWDGVHFTAVKVGANVADPTCLSLQNGAQFTFIGGEVQIASAVGFDNNTTPRSYQTRWRNTKEWGASSSRIRNYTTNAIFKDCEFYDVAFDLFRMPTVAPSIKARGSEYLFQYVGSGAGGADAKFVASNLENVDGTYDFDNYFGGWVELYNCKAGEALKVFSQYPNSSVWVRHCVPLYQDITITAKDTAGAVVQDVRFTTTESPTNAPTVTFTTAGGLKTWDFRTPLSYQTTTNSSGIATTTPVLNVWYWQSSFKESLRFPSSTATYEGRAYNYKTMTVSVLLGASAAIPVSAGVIGLDTATTVNEATAGAITKFTFTPSGTTGGLVVATANFTYVELWNYYRWWISQFANRSSNDTWTSTSGQVNMGLWTLALNTGVTGTSDSSFNYLYAPAVTLNGTATITGLYGTAAGKTSNIKFTTLVGSTIYVTDASGVQKDLQFDKTGSYVTYAPVASSGQWKAVIERYGYQRQSFVIDIAGGGEFSVTPTYIPDATIIQASLVTVSGYTTLNTPNEEYDYSCYMRTIQPQYYFMTKDGSAVDLGSADHDIDATAAQVWSYNGSKLITKSSNLARGSTLFEEHTTGLISTLNGATISIPFKDALGLRGSVTGLDPQGFGITWYLRYKLTSASTWTYLSGTGNTASILLASGTYELQVRAAGYDWAIKSLDTSVSLTVDMGLVFHLSKDNSTPQYTKTYDAVISALLDFNATNQAVAVTNTTSSIITASFAEVYQSLQRILHLPQLVWTWTSPVKAISISGTFSIPADNPVQFYLTTNSTSSFQLSCPVVHEATGSSANDRVRGNASGYSIILGSPASAESAGIAQTIIDRLGGTGFTTDIHSLNKIKSKVNAIFNNQ
jgi:hypothetical protein